MGCRIYQVLVFFGLVIHVQVFFLEEAEDINPLNGAAFFLWFHGTHFKRFDDRNSGQPEASIVYRFDAIGGQTLPEGGHQNVFQEPGIWFVRLPAGLEGQGGAGNKP